MERAIAIRGETIKLGQLLKLAGVVDAGGDARALLAERPALVNGAREDRRGRQLRDGDLVSVAGQLLRVRAEP
jgi:ribosome-associated protein